jgi:hypothetical protein
MTDASTTPADFACVKHERKDGEEAWVVYLGGEHVLWSWDEADADRVARLIAAALAARTAACARVAEAHGANARREAADADRCDAFPSTVLCWHAREAEAAAIARDIRKLDVGGAAGGVA